MDTGIDDGGGGNININININITTATVHWSKTLVAGCWLLAAAPLGSGQMKMSVVSVSGLTQGTGGQVRTGGGQRSNF